jgi:hypothetical protein
LPKRPKKSNKIKNILVNKRALTTIKEIIKTIGIKP